MALVPATAMMFAGFRRHTPMPHAIFYCGFAIHGTNDISRLGGPASHGCLRLHPVNAVTLFALVEHNGPRNTTSEISN